MRGLTPLPGVYVYLVLYSTLVFSSAPLIDKPQCGKSHNHQGRITSQPTPPSATQRLDALPTQKRCIELRFLFRVGLRCHSTTPRSCFAGTALITTVRFNPSAGVVCRNRKLLQGRGQPINKNKYSSSCRFRTAHRKDPCRGLTLHAASMWCHTSGSPSRDRT